MKKTIALGAYITEYSSTGPQDLVKPDFDGRGLHYSTPEHIPDEWTLVGTLIGELELVDTDTVIGNKVKSLRAQQQKALADAQALSTRLERKINQLLAIGFDAPVEVATEDDGLPF